jgi:signal transduction histidine kinase
VKLRWAVLGAASAAVGLTAATLAVALVAAGDASSAGTELSTRLVPAGASSVNLVSLYSDQQTMLRDYITAGPSGHLTSYDADAGAISAQQAELGRLTRGYQAISPELAATEAAYSRWLSGVAAPQLAAAARGDFTAAAAMQADSARIRPYVLTLRSAGYALQARIADAQRAAVGQLARAQDTLLGALVAMCAVVAASAGANVILLWRGRALAEQERAEERERLRQEAERERVARRAAQSERLESLGQLVGGVAHDFNNLINVIQGYADFTAELVSALAADDARLRPAIEDIEQVRAAAQKAARLTRQLLTFARHDVISPEVPQHIGD